MLNWLLEQDFMPHGHCYFWRPDILWMHVVSDAVIALAYYSIPVTLVYFAMKRRDIPFREILALFAAFIILCGTTHILGIITVWNPIYAVDGIIKAVTAVVSIATALVLIPLVPVALSMRTPADLEAANQKLQAEVERRRAAEHRLEQAVQDLHHSNQELEQFAYVASHDLQAPLRGVVNFTQLLKQECEGKLSQDGTEFLGFIEQGGRRMQSMVTDLLQLSRVGRGGQEPSRVSMGRVIADVRQQLGLDESQAEIVVGEMPEVVGVKAELSQLLSNLIGNAIKYVPPGTKPKIKVTATRAGDNWRFAVEDNGIGVPKDKLGEIFQIFRRLHGDDRYAGTGIGLALCRKIVERHGGKIWAESEQGRGSRFYFSLPAASTAQKQPTRGPVGGPAPA